MTDAKASSSNYCVYFCCIVLPENSNSHVDFEPLTYLWRFSTIMFKIYLFFMCMLYLFKSLDLIFNVPKSINICPQQYILIKIHGTSVLANIICCILKVILKF